MKQTIIMLLITLSCKGQIGQTSWERTRAKIDDDFIHMTGSSLTVLISGEIIYSLTDNPNGATFENNCKAVLGGLAVSLIIWNGKEYIWDKMLGKGVFSYVDIMNNCWGAVVGTIVEICIRDFKEHKKQKHEYKFKVYE
jgi:hypothetical protein